MKKFHVKFLREFEVQIEAVDLATANDLAGAIIGQFPEGSCKLLSVVAEGVVAVPDGDPPRRSWGKPDPSGGSPGTPVVRVEELVDQVSEAA